MTPNLLDRVSCRPTTEDELDRSGVVIHFGDNAFGDFKDEGEPYIILLDGKPVGWMQLTNEGIRAIEVLPEYQKQGVASAAVRMIYGDKPDSKVFQVSPASPSGTRLIRRFGHEPVETYESFDMDSFVQRAMFRDPEFKVSRIGGTADDPKFTYHTLRFFGPNWFGWVRISVIGKAWAEMARHSYALYVMIKRTSPSMDYRADNERTELVMDIGKDFATGHMDRLPSPDELYPHIEAAVDEERKNIQDKIVYDDGDLDEICYGLVNTVLQYLKGSKLIGESLEAEEFMREIVGQGGTRPLRWKTKDTMVGLGNQAWSRKLFTLPVSSFDNKVLGFITFTVDIDSPTDAEIGDGKAQFSAAFRLGIGSMSMYRSKLSDYKRYYREIYRQGADPDGILRPDFENDVWIVTKFRGKIDWIPKIKKRFETLVRTSWRPLLDQRDKDGNPTLKQNLEALRSEFLEAIVKKASIGENIDLSKSDLDSYAQVASDIQYATPWKRADIGTSERFVASAYCELNCPMKENPFKGYISVYNSSEPPVRMLRITANDGYSTGRCLIGYFKNDPSDRVLDEIRDSAVRKIKEYLSGDSLAGNSQNIAMSITADIQTDIRDDPEVLQLNMVSESSSDVGSFLDDFIRYDGVGEWVDVPTWPHKLRNIRHKSWMSFLCGTLNGVVYFTWFDWKHEDGISSSYQEVALSVTDDTTFEQFTVSHVSELGSAERFKFWVPPDQIDQAKASIRDFVADYLRPMGINHKPVIPNFNSAISKRLLNALSPWFAINESLSPEELWNEVVAHGGKPLEWYRDTRRDYYTFRLDISWLDQSHRGSVICSRFLEREYSTYWYVGYSLEVKDIKDSGYKKVCDYGILMSLTPKIMPQFQARTIEFAKWLIKTYGANNRLIAVYSHAGDYEVHNQQVIEIRKQFDLAVNLSGLNESSDDIEAFLRGVDLTGAMRPWATVNYRGESQALILVTHSTKIKRNKEIKSTFGYVKIDVNYYPPHRTATGTLSDPVIFISATHLGRGWHETAMKPIKVLRVDDRQVLPIVDEFARRYLVKKVVDGKTTSKTLVYFRSKLVAALKSQGMVTESAVEEPIGDIIAESVPGLRFRSECTASYSGQTNMTLYAELKGETVGRIDYVVYQGGVTVQWIKTREDMQRRGIATAMAKELQRQFPGIEVEWSAATNVGAEFIDTLQRDYQDNPDYGQLKSAYDKAKAEYDALQAEFDAWEGGPIKDNPEMFSKGERMNELDALIFDLEDQLRGKQPGKWLIREDLNPDEFLTSYEDEVAIEGWIGQDMNMSLPGSATRLYVNRKNVYGPVEFNIYMRPDNRQIIDLQFDTPFRISSWSSVTLSVYQGAAECPGIGIRLSATRGRPSFQPGNIDDFMADLKQAAHDFARRVLSGKKSMQLAAVSKQMFGLIYNRLKRKGWSMDVDEYGVSWDLDSPSFQENVAEGLSPDEMDAFVKQALACSVVWHKSDFYNDTREYEAVDWTMHISTPYGHLSPDSSFIRLRFYPVNEDGLQRVGMDGQLTSPVYTSPGPGGETAIINYYHHTGLTNLFVIKPEDGEALRSDVEGAFMATVGKAIDQKPVNVFRLGDYERSLKTRYSKLQRKWWAGPWIPPS